MYYKQEEEKKCLQYFEEANIKGRSLLSKTKCRRETYIV
jgi:hypothetical protein